MFESFLAVALAFPTVVYTVALGVALVYWVFVMVGAAHIDALGDGAADGAIDGAAKGVMEGAADAVGGHGHADAGDLADGGDGHDVGSHGAIAGLLNSLRLRSAPATVVLSVIIVFAWLLSIFGMQAAAAYLPPAISGIARFAVFLLAPLAALPFTSLVIRPLAPIFAAPHAAKSADLVGKVCTVRTGTVTDRFGEALLEDGGAGLVVRVRIDTGDTVKRGDQVVITSYDDERQEFTVAPMDNLLDERNK
jgi:hypothetical protein